ncbi:hypothetical protein O1M63_40905 [Streptomyces mirabilis]|nr:hypothetical protein [Streptomyces mirabilis]
MTARKTFLAALADTGVPLDTAFVELLTATAETSAKAVLDGYGADLVELRDGGEARAATRSLRTLVSVYVHEDSAYHHSAALLGPAAELADALAEEQYDNGLWEHGADGNPADTAFSIVDLSLIHHLLEEDAHEPTTGLRATIERILRLAGPSLATGGVHTANHRWLVCAALARIHARWPDPAYPERIETWLAEGIDQLPGGEYSERSPNYSAAVTNPALLVLARHYGRTDLYANVRDNLAANLYVIEPNGEVETVHSRRQDQTRVRHLPEFWLQYREMALRDGDGRFAAVAALLQERGTDQTFGETPIGERLAQVLDRPELPPLPEATSLPDDSSTTTTAAASSGSAAARTRRASSAEPTSRNCTPSRPACPPTRPSSRCARARRSSTRSGWPRGSSRSATSGRRTGAHGRRLAAARRGPRRLPPPAAARAPPPRRRLPPHRRQPLLVRDGLPAPPQGVPHTPHRSPGP